MRVLGALLFVIASAGAGLCIREMFTARRPRDLAFALIAPLAVVAAVLGLILIFVRDAL